MSLNKYTYIEWLGQQPQADDNEEATALDMYRWSVATAELSVEGQQTGSADELVEAMPALGDPVVLIIPGEKIVTQKMFYNEKEKRHFAKMLPYELEDNVVEDIDDLHFAVGKKQASSASTAYINREWFEERLQFFADLDITLNYCIADFQQMDAKAEEIIFWFSGKRLLVHSSDGVGFSSEGEMATMLLQSMLSHIDDAEIETTKYSIYITDSSSAEYDQPSRESIERIFHTLTPAATLSFHTRPPPRSLENSMAINLCSGSYAKKTPVSQQVKEFKWVGLLSVVAIMAFVSINFADIYALSLKNKQQKVLTEETFRRVIPRGVVNDPVRQLTRKLGQSATSSGEPSQAVYLLSNVAPVIQALGVDLSTINYSNKEKSLRINVQADSFNQVEKIRTDINAKGLLAELLSSNAIDDKFQARLRIRLEER